MSQATTERVSWRQGCQDRQQVCASVDLLPVCHPGCQDRQQVGASVDLLPVCQPGCQVRLQVGASVDVTYILRQAGFICRMSMCLSVQKIGKNY